MILHNNKWQWGDSYTIIEEDGMGMIEFDVTKDEPEVAYVKGLSVFRTHRLHGLGNRLLDEALQEAKKRGCKYAWLHASKEDFVFKWYLRRGFKYYGDKVNENGFVPMFMEL